MEVSNAVFCRSHLLFLIQRGGGSRVWLGWYNDDLAGVPPSIAVDRSMLRVSLRRARPNEGFGIIGVGTTSRWSHRILVTAVCDAGKSIAELLQVKVTGFLTDFPFSQLPIP